MAERSLVHKGLIGFVIQCLGIALSFLISIVLARFLGPVQLGIYSGSFALMGLVLPIADAGISTLFVRDGAAYLKSRKFELLKGVIQWGFCRLFIFSAGISIIGLIAMIFIPSANEQRLYTNIIMLLLLPIATIFKGEGNLLRIFDASIITIFFDRIIYPALFLCFCAILFVFLAKRDSVAAMTAQLGAACVILLLYSITLSRFFPPSIFKLIATYDSPNWKRTSFFFILQGGVGALNSNISLVLLAQLASEREVGLYKIAVQGSGLVSLGLQTIIIIVGPKLAAAYEDRDFMQMQKIIIAASRFAAIIAATGSLLFFMFGRPLLMNIFGGEYVESYPVLILLCVGHFINASVGPVGLLLSMSGYEKTVTKTLGKTACLNIVMNLLLIPFFGMVGAAIATTSSLVSWNLLLRKVAAKKLNIETLAFSMFQK